MKLIARSTKEELNIPGKMTRRKRNSFTLVELFIALSILLLLTSVGVGQFLPLLHRYQFNAAGKKLLSELNLTRRLSVSYRTDIDLTIERRGSQLFITRTSDEPMQNLGNFVSSLKEVARIDHVAQLFFEEKEVGKILLHFYGRGTLSPKGKLRITSLPSLKQEVRITIEEAPDFRIEK